MKKLVLFLFISTAIAFGVQSQNAASSGKSGDGTERTEPQVSASGVTAASVTEQKTVETSKPLTIEKKGCFKIASLSLSSGMNKYREIGANDTEWEKPNNGKHGWNSGNMGSMMSGSQDDILTKNQIILELGLNPWSKKMSNYNKKQELSISLFYSGSNLADRYTMDYLNTPGDTFVYNTIKYQTDTVARIQNSYVEKANVLGVGVQYLFKTDQEKRVSVFAGVGLDAAYALTARIYETYTKDSAVVLSFNGAKDDFFGDKEFDNGNYLGGEETKTSVNAKTTMFTSVYVPFGIDLKLCKKKDIWNQFRLFMKGNIGLETAIVVGSKTRFNPYMGCAMGLKFEFK